MRKREVKRESGGEEEREEEVKESKANTCMCTSP